MQTQTIITLKRKREDDPLETLLICQPQLKKKGQDGVNKNFQNEFNSDIKQFQFDKKLPVLEKFQLIQTSESKISLSDTLDLCNKKKILLQKNRISLQTASIQKQKEVFNDLRQVQKQQLEKETRTIKLIKLNQRRQESTNLIELEKVDLKKKNHGITENKKSTKLTNNEHVQDEDESQDFVYDVYLLNEISPMKRQERGMLVFDENLLVNEEYDDDEEFFGKADDENLYDEDKDSNAEDAVGNEYPDEEEVNWGEEMQDDDFAY